MKVRCNSLNYLDLEKDVGALCTHQRNCPLLRKTTDFNPLKMGDRFNYWVHGMPICAKSNVMTAMVIMEISSLDDMEQKRKRGDIIWRYTSEAPTERIEMNAKDRDANYAMRAMISMCQVTNLTMKEIIGIMKDNYFGEHNPKRKDRWNLGLLKGQPVWTRVENKENIMWNIRRDAEKLRDLLEEGDGKEGAISNTLDGDKIVKFDYIKSIDQNPMTEEKSKIEEGKETTKPTARKSMDLPIIVGDEVDIFAEAFQEEKNMENRNAFNPPRKITIDNRDDKDREAKKKPDNKEGPKETKEREGRNPNQDRVTESKDVNNKRKHAQLEDMTIRQLKQRIREIAEEEKSLKEKELSLKEERERINAFIKKELEIE
jgi:hypothetical protein